MLRTRAGLGRGRGRGGLTAGGSSRPEAAEGGAGGPSRGSAQAPPPVKLCGGRSAGKRNRKCARAILPPRRLSVPGDARRACAMDPRQVSAATLLPGSAGPAQEAGNRPPLHETGLSHPPAADALPLHLPAPLAQLSHLGAFAAAFSPAPITVAGSLQPLYPVELKPENTTVGPGSNLART